MTCKDEVANCRTRDETPTFEQLLEKLEHIVRQMEEGRLGLTESLEYYEQGVACLEKCYRQLEVAERRIELLSGVRADGTAVTESFAEQDMTLEQKADQRSGRRRRPDTSSPSGSTPPPDGSASDQPRSLF